jgi:hypothetical protein
VSEKRKSLSPPKRASKANMPASRTTHKFLAPLKGDEAPLLARLARAEEELGQMLVRMTRAEERARAAEAKVSAPTDERLREALAENEALRDAMREAATALLRALRPGPRLAPPPLPPLPTVDISEIAEMVESLRPPPHR